MKYVLLLFVLMNFNLFSSELINDSILMKSEWGPNWILGNGWVIRFEKKNIFTVTFEGEGCGGYQGTWKIEGKSVILNPEVNPECTPGRKPVKKRNCTLEKSEESLYYTQRLNCENNEYFWDMNNSLKPGHKRTYEKIVINTLGLQKTKTLSNVKFRNKPDIKSNIIKCSFREDTGSQKEFDFLPKGKEIYLIGRTNNKEKVEKWENYWYLISVSSNAYNGCYGNEGWIFGEFIEIK